MIRSNVAIVKHSTGYMKINDDGTDFQVITTGENIQSPELWFTTWSGSYADSLDRAIWRSVQANSLIGLERIK